MRDDFDMTSPTYTPHKLLTAAMIALKARSAHDLARKLEVDAAVMTRVRKRQVRISERLMVGIMDRTGWTIKHVRELAGMPFDGGAILATP